VPDSLSVFPTSWPYDGGAVPLKVRAHPRARRIALKIDHAGDAVEMVLPRRCSRGEALRFLEASRGWVDARLAKLVPVMDVPHRIRAMGPIRGQGPAWIEASEIRVAGDPAFLTRRTRDFLRGLAKGELSARADKMAALLERKVKRVSVRDTVSRWGSCARDGNLSFSWRLIFAPEAVIDYVVAHEVAHLVELNHSKRFWRVVERLHPGAKAERLWLNRNRLRLMRIG
jgi:hypothetical protein